MVMLRWDMRSVSAFERQARKRVSIIHFGQPWYTGGAPQPFYRQPLDAVREHGAIPLVDWGSWDLRNGGSESQPAFSLERIIDGSFDWYIRLGNWRARLGTSVLPAFRS